MPDAAFIERRFDSQGTSVVIRFWQPTLQPAGEYQCRWGIEWGDGERSAHFRH